MTCRSVAATPYDSNIMTSRIIIIDSSLGVDCERNYVTV